MHSGWARAQDAGTQLRWVQFQFFLVDGRQRFDAGKGTIFAIVRPKRAAIHVGDFRFFHFNFEIPTVSQGNQLLEIHHLVHFAQRDVQLQFNVVQSHLQIFSRIVDLHLLNFVQNPGGHFLQFDEKRVKIGAAHLPTNLVQRHSAISTGIKCRIVELVVRKTLGLVGHGGFAKGFHDGRIPSVEESDQQFAVPAAKNRRQWLDDVFLTGSQFRVSWTADETNCVDETHRLRMWNEFGNEAVDFLVVIHSSVSRCVDDCQIKFDLHSVLVVNGVRGDGRFAVDNVIDDAEPERVTPFNSQDVIGHSIDQRTFPSSGRSHQDDNFVGIGGAFVGFSNTEPTKFLTGTDFHIRLQEIFCRTSFSKQPTASDKILGDATTFLVVNWIVNSDDLFLARRFRCFKFQRFHGSCLSQCRHWRPVELMWWANYRSGAHGQKNFLLVRWWTWIGERRVRTADTFDGSVIERFRRDETNIALSLEGLVAKWLEFREENILFFGADSQNLESWPFFSSTVFQT